MTNTHPSKGSGCQNKLHLSSMQNAGLMCLELLSWKMLTYSGKGVDLSMTCIKTHWTLICAARCCGMSEMTGCDSVPL